MHTLLDDEFLRALQANGQAPDLAALAARLESSIAERQKSLREAQRRSGMRPLRFLLWLGAGFVIYLLYSQHHSKLKNG